MPRFTSVFLVLFLISCPGFSVDQTVGAVCKTYSSARTALVPLKSRMTVEEVELVDQANNIVDPLCDSWAAGILSDPENTLRQVRRELQKLLLVKGRYIP